MGNETPTIANLATVPFEFIDCFGLLHIFFCDKLICDLALASLLTIFFQLLEEVVPNLVASVLIERVIQNCNVDSGHDGFVELPHSVGSQKKNTLEVFKRSQED